MFSTTCNVLHALYKIYPNRARKGPIVHRIRNVTPVVGKPPLDIVIHAPTWPQHSVSPPPLRFVERVGVRLCGDHCGDTTVVKVGLLDFARHLTIYKIEGIENIRL